MREADETPPTRYVAVRGVRLAYTARGTGPVVLDAHGLSSSRAGARRFGLDFSPVADVGHTLISYDARGHGESAGTDASADYTWAALADDLLALADHFSPDAPVSAIGSSMGTGTILHAVTLAPERFDRLVLTAPPTAWETRANQGAVYRQLADLVESGGLEALARMSRQTPPAAIFADLPDFPPAPDVDAALLPTIYRGAADTDLPSLHLLAAITQPTMILAWATDPGHPLSTAQKLAGVIAGSTLQVAETSDAIRGWGREAARFLAASPPGHSLNHPTLGHPL